jgi:peroxiredoxin
MEKLIILAIVLFYSNLLHSQEKIQLNYSCSYYGEKIPSDVYTFKSDDEASEAVKLITDASGLSSKFITLACNIPNASATIINNQRYILYNQSFMYNISKRINYWASLSILAHEIGHHLEGHSLMPGGSRPSLELEADRFSGFILARLGSSLEDAQSAINYFVPEEGTFTHPGRAARLAAIANGWLSVMGNKNNNVEKVKTYSTYVGSYLSNFTQNDPNGNLVKLSDFQGKYVLVNFWASWSSPDREENKYLVQAHEWFKSQGFTILSISLDVDKSSWMKAIAMDKLSWTNVSDLNGWQNNVATKFGIRSVPSNFLLDPQGKIIVKNLRGDNLLKTLYQIYN